MSALPPGQMTVGEIIDLIAAGQGQVVMPVADWETLKLAVQSIGRAVNWNCRQIGPIVYVWKATIVEEKTCKLMNS